MFVVTVDIELHPDAKERFIRLIRKNARESIANEPRCLLFDICSKSDVPGDVFLYEVYTNAAAFEAHLESAHFNEFDNATASMIASKRVITFDELAPAAK